ncbi:MAG: prephenate dehydratase [Alphaproteobacteria bacterium]|nr:prephenate dehydratase [Alphaproteobacteria bacterium]
MKLKIAYQGVAGAYSHIAAMSVYPNQEYIACDTFENAMDLVQKGFVDFAMIPVENSNAGRVADVHFLLPQTGLSIVGEFFLRIEHQLLGLKGSRIEDITQALSHPQALAQCADFLQKHNIKPVARIDTAKSCEFVLEEGDNTKAAIASKLAAEIYGLDILASNIENASNNTTRFLIMSKTPVIPEDDGEKFITSFIFKAKNIPAALYKALGGFATNGINITKLESYLLEGKFVSAQFYVEIEAHPSQQSFKNAFEELKFFSEHVHVLGTYQAHPYRYL